MTAMLALLLTLGPPPMADLLHGVRGVESSFGADTRDGDLHRPICERSVGDWQVTPRAVRHLVKLRRLDAKSVPGFSLTNCAGIRKWLKTKRGGYTAARLYLDWLLDINGRDVERALYGYNCGPYATYGESRACLRYAGQVLAIASGEGG